MVKRTKTEYEPLKPFKGVLQELEVLESEFDGKQTKQIHMAIEPIEKEAIQQLKDSKTGMVHNYVSITAKTEDDSVPDGSNLDRYLCEIEAVLPEAKDLENYMEAFELLKGKEIKWTYKKLGKAFKQYEGKSYYVPQAVL